MPGQLHFAACTLDRGTRRLFRDGREVHVTPKALAVLELLIDRRPEAVAKRELLDRVWAGTFVTDASLARTITELRHALGDDARRSRIIRTVHTFGYAFAAAAVASEEPSIEPPDADGCWLLLGTREYRLRAGTTVIGRDRTAGVWLDAPSVSRRHARIAVSGTEAWIGDLGSRNGTFVCGRRVEGVVALGHGDEVCIGPYRLVFAMRRSSGVTETVQVHTGRPR